VHEITNPMGFFSRLKLDYPVSIGSYRFGSSPDEPMVLHLVHVPVVRDPSLPVRDARRIARERFYATTFDEFEFHVRDELTRMLGESGFDADDDIAAITVNRWGHGYAYSGDELHADPREPDRPFEIARARWGNIVFAGSDAAWMPLTSAAIAEAHGAVLELFDGA
jgi:spermidine dehydrogenase